MFINDEILQELSTTDRVGTLDSSDPTVYTIYAAKDRYLVRLQVKIENNIITNAVFKAKACSVVLATLSMACRNLISKPIADIGLIKNADFISHFKLGGHKEEANVFIEACLQQLVNEWLNGKTNT